MKKRFIRTDYGAIIDNYRTDEEGKIIFDEDIDGLNEMCHLLNKQNEEIERLKKSLNYACEAVFDETLPYKEIQEMKQKYGKYTVGIILEDVLFYYEKLAEEEIKNANN